MRNIKLLLLILLLVFSFNSLSNGQRTMAIKSMNVDKIDNIQKRLILNGKEMRLAGKDKAELAFMFTDSAKIVQFKDVELDQQYYFLLYKEESNFRKSSNEFNQIIAIFENNPMETE